MLSSLNMIPVVDVHLVGIIIVGIKWELSTYSVARLHIPSGLCRVKVGEGWMSAGGCAWPRPSSSI